MHTKNTKKSSTDSSLRGAKSNKENVNKSSLLRKVSKGNVGKLSSRRNSLPTNYRDQYQPKNDEAIYKADTSQEIFKSNLLIQKENLQFQNDILKLHKQKAEKELAISEIELVKAEKLCDVECSIIITH